MKFLIAYMALALANPSINYLQPNQYLTPGAQSTIGNAQFKSEIDKKLKKDNPTIMDIGNAWHWKRKYFPGSAGGGANIGKMNIDQLVTSKQSTGCHDDGLLIVSIAREMGVPAVMIDAMGIKWAKDFLRGTKGPYEGHVLVELFLQGHWWLVDSTSGDYFSDYDHENPIIPINHGDQVEGYYVIAKGKDTWDYGIHDLNDLKKMQEDFAKKTDLTKLIYPKYSARRF